MISDPLAVGKVVPGAAEEHAGVEVDALIPAGVHERELLVDEVLLSVVVGISDISPSILVEEVVSTVSHGLEVGVGLSAVGH